MFKNIENGYVFYVYFNQADGELKTVEKVSCSLNEKEYSNIEKVLLCLGDAIMYNFEKSTEDVASYIQKKTELEEDFILNLIMPLIMPDLKHDCYIAYLAKVEVFKYEDGKVQSKIL